MKTLMVAKLNENPKPVVYRKSSQTPCILAPKTARPSMRYAPREDCRFSLRCNDNSQRGLESKRNVVTLARDKASDRSLHHAPRQTRAYTSLLIKQAGRRAQISVQPGAIYVSNTAKVKGPFITNLYRPDDKQSGENPARQNNRALS